jgi:hypothetical protein
MHTQHMFTPEQVTEQVMKAPKMNLQALLDAQSILP